MAMRPKTALALLFLLVSSSIQAADDLGICQLSNSYSPLLVSEAERKKFYENYVQPLRVASKVAAKISLRTYSYRDGGGVLHNAKRFRDEGGCVMWFLEPNAASLLNVAEFVQPAGRKNPFGNISDGWKGFDSTDGTKVSYLVVGWIPTSVESKLEANGTYVIRMKSNEKGFLEYALAIASPYAHRGAQWDKDLVMDYIASAESSRKMGEWFYIVPDNSTLKRRVRVDLVDEKTGDVIGSTPCAPDKCYPQMVFGEVTFKNKDGSTGRVCGAQSACPQFSVRPEYGMATMRPQTSKRPSLKR